MRESTYNKIIKSIVRIFFIAWFLILGFSVIVLLMEAMHAEIFIYKIVKEETPTPIEVFATYSYCKVNDLIEGTEVIINDYVWTVKDVNIYNALGIINIDYDRNEQTKEEYEAIEEARLINLERCYELHSPQPRGRCIDEYEL